MRRRKQHYINGAVSHRRTETDYMSVLLDAVPVEAWRAVVTAAVDAAKAGDAGARLWLAQYLIGRPGATAPTPLTLVVQQLSGRDPVVDELAAPHIQRLKYPTLHGNDDLDEALRAEIAAELRALEAPRAE